MKCSENMNLVGFSSINFEVTSIKQRKTLSKQGCIHENTSYKW